MDYYAGRQNWDVDIDSYGIVYFGNSEGLLYNVYGQWNLKPLNDSSAVRSVFVKNDTIWVGGAEFGFFARDNEMQLQYNRVGDFKGGLVWNILMHDQNIVFHSEFAIKYYNPTTKEIVNVSIDKGLWALTEWDDRIWLMRRDGHLGYMNDTVFYDVTTFNAGINNEVRKLFVHNNQLYILVLDGRLFSFDGELVKEVQLPKSIEKRRIFTAISYNEHSYCLGTISDGFIQISSDTHQVIRKVSAEDGLIDNTVLAMKKDEMGNVWLGLDYGLAKIELQNSINSIFNKGATYFVKNYDRGVYLATNKGVYFSDTTDDFMLVDNSAGQVWRIKEDQGQLIACHNNGLLLLENNTSRFIFSGYGVTDFSRFGNSNFYLLSTYDGLMFFERKPYGFELKYNLNIWGNPICEYDKANECMWVQSSTAGLLQFKLNEDNTLDGSNINGIKHLFVTDYGFVFYNGEYLLEYKDGMMHKLDQGIFENAKGAGIQALDISKDATHIASVQNNKVCLTVSLPDGNFHSYDNTFSSIGNNLLDEYSFIDLNNDELRIATDRGVTVFNMSFKSPSLLVDKKPVISSVDISENNEVINHLHYPFKDNSIALSAGKKDIEFRFGYPAQAYDVVEYRWRLDPYDGDWSDWSSEVDRKNYTKLNGGIYKFQLQSRLNNNKIETSEIIIEVEDLWYQTGWVVVPFILVLVLSIAVTVIFMSRRHQKKIGEEKKRHKQKVMEKNIHLKNEQLLQYIEIISHKNQFLNEVRQGLERMRNSEAQHWVNKITNEVNHEKKEFLFHKIFSELHQDFISRITEKYPSLTSNDIRMLSFIRVNLDNKEIANLMNISLRSMDTNRYRLRKKLKLEREVDLNQFIRDF